MRRRMLAVVGALVAATTAAPGSTAVAVPAPAATPVPPGFATANVEWLANVPLHADTAGARVHGKHLYVTSSHELTIYDISNPELPVPKSTLPIPQEPYYAEEDVDTNGKVLLIGTVGRLLVFDVRDPARPALTGQLADGDEHTVTCVLDCTWAYGSAGGIYDLRNPASPKHAGDWTSVKKPSSTHDVTEVAPGLVLTSSRPIMLLDARANPARPKLLAVAKHGDERFIHANLWPNRGTDRFLLVGGETGPGGCERKTAGAFMTWDASSWKRSKSFRLIDEYRPPDTTPDKGGFPTSTFCSHWFTPRPGYRNGGIVAAGWYEHGTRFLRVSPAGRISEVGWFIPAGTSVSAAYWVTDDLLYLLDYNRGLDIVRFHDTPPAPAPTRRPRPGELAPDAAPLFPARLVGQRLPGVPGLVCPVPAAR